MESEKLSSEEEAGLSSLDFLFDISDLSEGIDVLAERFMQFSSSMLEEIAVLEQAHEQRPEVVPRLANYSRIVPSVYIGDIRAYSLNCPSIPSVPDFLDFAEIISGGDYFFI